jgi:hypothetical protein
MAGGQFSATEAAAAETGAATSGVTNEPYYPWP